MESLHDEMCLVCDANEQLIREDWILVTDY